MTEQTRSTRRIQRAGVTPAKVDLATRWILALRRVYIPVRDSQSVKDAGYERRLDAARGGDERAFEYVVGPHVSELRRHCYRMLASQDDAKDAVQDVLFKAWRALPRFDGRSSVRSWLFRIATNTCLNMIERNPKRVLRIEGSSGANADAIPGLPLSESVWIGPLPDDLVDDEAAGPEHRYDEHESLELAFVAALQHLTGRQRAVLVLREVLGFSGAETAEVLGTNPDSVYSLVQRAHRAVDTRLPSMSQQETARLLGDNQISAITARYIAAWEANDADALAAMLAADAVMTMPPRPTWFDGREAIRTFVAREPMASSTRWRMEPTRANGQLAFACYDRRAAGGRERLHALHVLTLRADGHIGEITAFLQQPARD